MSANWRLNKMISLTMLHFFQFTPCSNVITFANILANLSQLPLQWNVRKRLIQSRALSSFMQKDKKIATAVRGRNVSWEKAVVGTSTSSRSDRLDGRNERTNGYVYMTMFTHKSCFTITKSTLAHCVWAAIIKEMMNYLYVNYTPETVTLNVDEFRAKCNNCTRV